MNDAKIVLVGLGPGDPKLITREAWEILENCTEIWLRTRQHSVVNSLPEHLQVHSFDYLYEQHEAFEKVYSEIVDQVLELARREDGVIYCVPGHPFIAEATCPEIARRAHKEGLSVRIAAGLSFIEPTLTSLGVDALPRTVLVDAMELAGTSVPLFPPSTPALIAQIYSREVASDVKLTLMANYPDQHPVKMVHAAGTADMIVESLELFEIDRSDKTGLLTTLYVPPLGRATSFEEFQELVAHLRSPDGCSWDREQDHQTLRADLLEESYEALAAIDEDDQDAMREEFGDLLLLVVMHTQIATEYGEFSMPEVLHDIHSKIVNRHPHVFGDSSVEDPSDVLRNWERIKAQERAENGTSEAGILDGVDLAIPALLQANKYQERAAHVGFDWPDVDGVWGKFNEEILEVKTAQGADARADELGDLLFALVNLARWYRVDPESALRKANVRFRKRFQKIEEAARTQGRQLADMSLEEMEYYWQLAKNEDSDLPSTA